MKMLYKAIITITFLSHLSLRMYEKINVLWCLVNTKDVLRTRHLFKGIDSESVIGILFHCLATQRHHESNSVGEDKRVRFTCRPLPSTKHCLLLVKRNCLRPQTPHPLCAFNTKLPVEH